MKTVTVLAWLQAGGTLGLLGVTFWYARTTSRIAGRNTELVEATAEMAEATRAMAKHASDDLFLRSAPIITVFGYPKATWNPATGPSHIDLVWKNVGHALALDVYVGLAIRTADGIVKPLQAGMMAFPGALSPNQGTPQLPINLQPDEVDAIERDTSRLVYVASYRDIFGNRYESRWRIGSHGGLEVHRESGHAVIQVT